MTVEGTDELQRVSAPYLNVQLNFLSGIPFRTLMVRSPLAETMKVLSKSTTFTAARCPTNTRRRSIFFGDVMSQTAIDRSFELNMAALSVPSLLEFVPRDKHSVVETQV